MKKLALTAALAASLGVSACATNPYGYNDPYYFSRMFSRTLGISPRDHVNRVRQNRHGGLMGFDEPEQDRLRDSTKEGSRP